MMEDRPCLMAVLLVLLLGQLLLWLLAGMC